MVDRGKRPFTGMEFRVWFWGYCAYLLGLCVVSLLGFSRMGFGDRYAFYKCIWLIGLYMFYFSLASTFVPLPTSWFVLFLDSPSGLSFIAPLERVILVALLGSFSTAVSHLNEYYLGNYILQDKSKFIKETKIYRWASQRFDRYAFWLLFVFNVVPVSADPVRWLAIISRYPRGRFFVSQMLGRFVRYALLGIAAEIFKLTIIQIMVLQVAILAVPLSKLLWDFLSGRRYSSTTFDT